MSPSANTSTRTNPPREVTERYASLAAETASAWAQKVLVNAQREGHSPELQTVAAVVLDLRSEVLALRQELAAADRLAKNLASDMLDTLHVGLVQGEDADYEPLHYLARGWRRDHDDIWLSGTTEAEQIDAKLAESQLGIE